MFRPASSIELQKTLGEICAELEESNESLLVRDDGEVVALLLAGNDYQQYRQWIAEQTWEMIEQTRVANASLEPSEISDAVDRIVDEVRSDNRRSRVAS